MTKKFLLSCTVVAAVVLSGIHLNAHAKNLEISESKTEVSNKTYEIICTKKGGKIIGKHLTIIGNKETNTNTNMHAITTEGSNTAIELLDDTIIKGTDSSIFLGLKAKNGATLKMTGGTITVSNTGANFLDSKSTENKLKDITISNSKAPLSSGVVAYNNSQVTLENVKVTNAMNSITANNKSEITILGGIFNTIKVAISSYKCSSYIIPWHWTPCKRYRIHDKNDGRNHNHRKNSITCRKRQHNQNERRNSAC
ncbi:hypothetical protein [Bartonella sp. AC90GZZY]|uniref:hypothetical protein n=1 Tax=Bartonella sp. AC90GZZY TaxID=3243461 RepID=UPI0035D0D0C0